MLVDPNVYVPGLARKLSSPEKEHDRFPDLTLFDTDTDGPITPDRMFWRAGAVDFEAKLHASEVPQAPRPGSDTNPARKEVIRQGADYARIRFATRPFQRFRVCISICGLLYTVHIYDRGGAVFSETLHISNNLSDFIRLIRRLSRDVNHVALGLQPDVKVVEGSFGGPVMPVFQVPVQGQWFRTIGVPIWQSMGLVGRGTEVWRVEEIGKGAIHVLKSAWRHGDRDAESSFYEQLKNPRPVGVARYYIGGDVVDESGTLVTVSTHRHGLGLDVALPRVLHRLVLNSVGRPLWQAATEQELVDAFRHVILGE